MGRYFLFRMHPFGVGELLRTAGRFDLPERKPCTGGYGLGYNRFIPTKERIQ